jgi:hypothetical protein
MFHLLHRKQCVPLCYNETTSSKDSDPHYWGCGGQINPWGKTVNFFPFVFGLLDCFYHCEGRSMWLFVYFV